MPGPARSTNIGFPIRVFLDIPSSDTLDAFTALINDVNKYLSLFTGGVPNNINTVAVLTATLPQWASGIATDGRGVGEGPGAGTGIPVYMKGGVLRTYSTDQTVQT